MSDAQGGAMDTGSADVNESVDSSVEQSQDTQAGDSSQDLPNLTPQQLQRLLKSQRFTPKVDGETVEVDIDELMRGYAHSAAANKRLKAAAEAVKKAQQREALIEAVREGDMEALVEIFGDEGRARQVAEHFLSGHIEYMSEFEKLSQLYGPEKAEKMLAAERELERRKKADEKAAEEERRREAETAKAEALQEIDEEFAEAFKKAGKKPTRRLLRRLAEDKIAWIRSQKEDQPFRDLPADRILKKVYAELDLELADRMADADAEELLRIMPESAVKVLRRYFAEAARSQDPLRSGRSQPSGADTRRHKSKPRNFNEAFSQLEKRYGS